MFTHIHTYIHGYIHTYIRTYTYIHTYVRTYIHTYLHTHAYICAYVHTCMHAYCTYTALYRSTCLPACLPTYIITYIPVCLRVYIYCLYNPHTHTTTRLVHVYDHTHCMYKQPCSCGDVALLHTCGPPVELYKSVAKTSQAYESQPTYKRHTAHQPQLLGG